MSELPGLAYDELLELLDPECVQTGQFVVDTLRPRRVHYNIVVGIGEASWKLALAIVRIAGKTRFPMRWIHGFVGNNNQVRLDPPVERGGALLVSNGRLPDEQLVKAVYGIREQRGTISDMVLMTDEIGPHAVARTLGVVVHEFRMNEVGIILPLPA